MGKTWDFIICYNKPTKIYYLSTARHKNKTQKKYFLARAKKTILKQKYQVASHKALLCSHIARIRTLFLQDGQVS
jgi:hypothetical protein